MYFFKTRFSIGSHGNGMEWFFFFFLILNIMKNSLLNKEYN